jgi:hypothetical protein
MNNNKVLTDEEYYELLISCYKTGQMTEKQWNEHLKDLGFYQYVNKTKIRMMKRYNIHVPPYSNSAVPDEYTEGKWVKWEDVKAVITANAILLQENEELKQELAIINRPPRQYSEDKGEGEGE